MDRDIFLKNYWRYYLLLEGKFLKTIDYVELSEDNFSTYSNEYAYLLQSIGGELDTFFKVYCGLPLNSYQTMKKYNELVLGSYPEIVFQRVSLQEYNLELKPFENWADSGQSLEWWTAYNSVKHNRCEKICLASLKNILNILSALFLVEMKYLQKITEDTQYDRPDKESELFYLPDWNFHCVPASQAFLVYMEKLGELLDK